MPEPVVVVVEGEPDGAPDIGGQIAEAVAEAVTPFVTVIEELTASIVAQSTPNGEPDAMTERIVNAEHEIEELRDESVTRADFDAYATELIALAEAKAAEVASTIVTPDVTEDAPVIVADDATVVIPDVSETSDDGERKGLLGRLARAW